MSSYHPDLWIVVCVYFLIQFYLFLSTWASGGLTFFILRVIFVLLVQFRSINSYDWPFFVLSPKNIREWPLKYCHCHSELPSFLLFFGRFIFYMRHSAMLHLSDCCVFPSPVWHTDSPLQLVHHSTSAMTSTCSSLRKRSTPDRSKAAKQASLPTSGRRARASSASPNKKNQNPSS